MSRRKSTRWYHGGVPGLNPGDMLVPSPPHQEDGCPICTARAEGRVCRVGEYRAWLYEQGPLALPGLEMLHDAADHEAIDPPSSRAEVYLTTSRPYSRWYAARSRGDLYMVEPVGPVTPSDEDPFPSVTAPAARVLRVVERGVTLQPRERQKLTRLWGDADARAGR